MRVGLIGCGNIAPVYFDAGHRFDNFRIVACADQDHARAEAAAALHGVPRALDPKALLADPEIDLVLILTPPPSHADLIGAATAAGKHVYTEKPLALDAARGRELLGQAARIGVTVGCAPDTVLGAGIQTARKLIDDGWIGRPVSATAFMQCAGHESWHPDPAFYYAPGGGPLFDMGPYYLSALVTLLGPVESVCAMAGAAFDERVVTSAERYGERIPVRVPTHVAGVLRFVSGAIVTLVMSFDVVGHTLPHLEIHGSAGSLRAPDPNTFGGPVLLKRRGADAFTEMPLSHPHAVQSRGLGLAEMVDAIRAERSPRADGDLALHVLGCMEALHTAARESAYVSVRDRAAQPAPMPMEILDRGAMS
ncbi:MAG: Gfo/Idh/MocA family oxidoreductase [Candidatus Hydrogenedentes bacterium]|nr:Gfo/Idh/MocA family oxidoreductase [Candidatus Hydrogenedentota bacterium]